MFTLPIELNGQQESIRFTQFPLTSKRQEYELECLLGRDADGEMSEACCKPQASSLLAAMLEFVRTGQPQLLADKGLVVVENPGNDVISRNITLLDPQAGEMYVIGSVGLLHFDKDAGALSLEDPVLDDTFNNYQSQHARNPGGVVYFSEKGLVGEINQTPLGVSFYNTTRYNLMQKIERTEKLRKQGIETPYYLAAGRIKNLGEGEWGFSIYKTALTPDYLMNLNLLVDESINLKPGCFDYLQQKYRMLGKLHREQGLTHGQPTVTNACITLAKETAGSTIACTLKDMDTLRRLPESTSKTMLEGPCPHNVGIKVKKSPHVAAMAYDLQVAITQEFNLLLIACQHIPDPKVKLQFVQYQFAKMIEAIAAGYGLNNAQQSQQIVGFCLKHFVNGMRQGNHFQTFNEVLGGLSAHALFGLSDKYKDQIEVVSV